MTMPEFTHHRSIHGEAGTVPSRPPNPRSLAPIEPWECERCGRHLATLQGGYYVRPDGSAGTLPGAIRCRRCRKLSRKGYGDGTPG